MITLYILIGLVFLIIVHELGHFLAAKFFGIRVDEFGLGFPPRLFAWKKGETVYSLNWIPFGGFVRIFGESPFDTPKESDEEKRSFQNQPAWKRAVVLAAGVGMNVIASWLLFSFIFLIGTEPAVVIQTVADNSPAAAVGLETGDIISGFSNTEEFIEYIDNHRGEEINLKISRGEEELSFSVIPRLSPPPGEGSLGVSLISGGVEAVPFGLNFWEGAKTTFSVIVYIIIALAEIIQLLLVGSVPEVVGPVGLLSFAGQLQGVGLVFILHLLAMISLNLAVINLLPFPALDGGRLIFLLIEKIKGSPLPPKFESYSNAFGFILLLFVMVLVTIRDISLLF